MASAIRRVIEDAAFLILRRERLPNALGDKYVLSGRTYVLVYDTGAVVLQGRLTANQRKRLSVALGLAESR